MKYILDTNICVYWLNGNMKINDKISSIDIDDISISVITIAELLYGAYNSGNVHKNLNRVREFEESLTIVELNKRCLESYAQIKSKLRAEGKIIDDFDILIAATAIVNNSVLVTNNTKHFERIDGLIIENWILK